MSTTDTAAAHQVNTARDSTPLLKRTTTNDDIIVYRTRWYICGVFFLFCILQSSMWGFFSPIQKPLKQLYGWHSNFIEWLGNTANITFCIMVLPLAMLVDGPRGMRHPLLATAVALCLNSGLRCLPVDWVTQTGYNVFSMISMVCNGIAGTLETLSPPVLSSIWFPVHERSTATAIMATANTLGSAVGFLVAFVVPSDGSKDDIESALTKVYWGMFIVCIAILVTMIVYFPNKPPTPPAASCTVEKVDLMKGIGTLLVHGRFWVVAMSMAVPLGVYAAWLNVLDINLKDFHFSQTDAAWVGFGSATAGATAGVIAGRVADVFPGKLTRIIAVMYTISSGCLVWFSLICFEVIPFSLPQVYVSSILIGFSMYSTYPLFFELSMETTFPMPEACTSGFLTMAQAVIQAIFLALPVESLGTKWMNYTLMICPLVFAVVLLNFKEVYSRLNMDLEQDAHAQHHTAEGSA